MSTPLQIALLIILLFIVLPVASVAAITLVRFIYRKIRKKDTMSLAKIIAVLLVFIISFAVIPPIPYLIAESFYSGRDIVVTGKIATLNYDKNYDINTIRYITDNDNNYQELLPSLSDSTHYDLSNLMDFEYGKPMANILEEDPSFLKKYCYAVFNYPVNSEIVYPLLNEGLENYISLEKESLFVPQSQIEERVEYYEDITNYNFYVEDYNTGKISEITLDSKSATEIFKLSLETDIIDPEEIEADMTGKAKFEDSPDYDVLSLNGESKDGLLLRSIGSLYQRDGKFYQMIYEDYTEDGTSIIYAYVLSEETNKMLNSYLPSDVLSP